MVDKNKIYEPLIRKIIANYTAQGESYGKISALTKNQSKINNQQEISTFTEIASEKEVLFEEIAKRNEFLKKAKEDMIKVIGIDEFTISALKENINSPLIDELYEVLVKVGEDIKELELAERENEENLKRILKLS